MSVVAKAARAANTHAVGYGGAAGGALVFADLWAVRSNLMNPTFLSNFVHEINHRSPGAATYTIFGLLIGAMLVLPLSFVAALFGRTPVIPDDAERPDPLEPARVAARELMRPSAGAIRIQAVAVDVPRPSRPSVETIPHDAGSAGGRSPKMSTTLQGGIADAVLSLYEANKPKLVALVKAQNVPVETFVENAAIALVSKNPMLNLVLQGEIKGSGPALVTALGGEEDAVFAALDAMLKNEAKALGG